MKICIPTIGNKGLDEMISPHFGSAPTFTLCDLETSQIEVIVNDNEHHSHGMCHPLGALEGKAVDAVVCGGMGRRAVAGLNAGGVKAFLCKEGTVADIIREFKAGTIAELTQESACAGHGCH
jgi:predicted Fe-Mo cluster-binding NifX family protein